LKILAAAGLLAMAVGTQVVAVRHSSVAALLPPAAPVVVRKSAHANSLPKTVRAVPGRLLVHRFIQQQRPTEVPAH